MELVGLALFATAILTAFAFGRPRRSAQIDTWSTLARPLAFRMTPDSGSAIGVALEATVENFRVRITTDKEDGSEVTRFTASRGAIPLPLTIENRITWSAGLFGEDSRRLVTGDTDFDARTMIRTDTPLVRALLDAGTRRALLDALSGPGAVDIERGTVTVVLPAVLSMAFELDEQLAKLLAVARRLSIAEHDVPARLAAIATSDPDRGCRLHCYRALLASFADDAVTAEVTRAVGPGFSPAMRLLAAEQLDDVATISALAMGADREVAVAACEAVMVRGDGRAEARLIALMGDESPEVQRRAAEVLGRHGSVAAVEVLLQCAERTGLVNGAELRKAARDAVAQIQSRLEGAEGGRLSLVSGATDGALSVAEGAGALTLIGAGERER